MIKARMRVSIDTGHWGARAACGFMLTAALVRLWYYLTGRPEGTELWLHLWLPVLAATAFLAGMAAGDRWARPASMLSVVLGVVFFILKAQTFTPVHKILCTILYLAVLVLYNATVMGFLPTKKLLYPLFGLPLLYHIFVEDTKLYLFADPPVPVWHWLPEISVLCIMAGLFCLTFAMKTEKR